SASSRCTVAGSKSKASSRAAAVSASRCRLPRCPHRNADRSTSARIAAMTAADPSPRKAAAWMAGWLTAMVVMAVAGRAATQTLHVFQIMEMRSLIGFVLLWPLIHASGGVRVLGTARLGQQVARNAVHYAAQFGWFFALTLIPIAQVVAIEF